MEYRLTFGQYQKGLEQGEFLGLKCNKCQVVTFPPQSVCRNCNGMDLETIDLSGNGTLRTFTVIRVAPEGRKPPYVVAMAELEEGAWVIGNLIGIPPDDADMGLIGKRIKMGSRVQEGDTYSTDDFRVITFELI